MTTELPQVTRLYQNHTLDSTRWQHYRPRPDDIVIATSPKSGTTWMKEIVGQLILWDQVPPEGADTQRSKAAVWFEPRWVSLDQSIERLETQQHRRFIQSHLPLDGLPFYPQVRYIVVGRDARDVFMSVWNHHANFTPAFLDRINSIPIESAIQCQQRPLTSTNFGAIGSIAAGSHGRARAIPGGAICIIARVGGPIAICPTFSLYTTTICLPIWKERSCVSPPT